MVDIVKQDMTYLWAVGGDVVAPDNAKIQEGWAVEVVPRQWWNWMQYRADSNIAYMLQKGIPEWDATTEYLANKSFVSSAGIVYKCLITNTNMTPLTNPTRWARAFADYTVASAAIGGLTPSAGAIPYFSSTTGASTFPTTSYARNLMNVATDSATYRQAIGAQTVHTNLTALSGVAAVTNGLPYFTSTTAMGVTTLTAFGRSLIDDADAASCRATLGLGTSATRDAVTSQTDNTVGRLLVPGSGYLLSNSALEADGGTSTTLWYGNRFKAWDGSAGSWAPTTGVAIGLEMGYGANRRSHVAVTTGNQMYYRYTSDPTDTSSWKQVWDSGNLLRTVSDLDTSFGRILSYGNFGIGRGVAVASGADVNSMIQPATYSFTSGTIVNSPVATAQHINVTGRVEYPHQESSLIYQNRFYRRAANKAFPTTDAADWTPWVEMYHTGNLIKTTSQLDTTTGSILKVGDFGLGAVQSGTPTIPSFVQHNANGFYRSVTAGTSGAPAGAPAHPLGAQLGLQVLVTGYPGNTFYLAVDGGGNMYSSVYNGTVLGVWRVIQPGDQGNPAGTVITYAGGGTTPTGYLRCDGSVVSRTTYSALFAAIGTTYGAGDGSTTFSLPDLRGEFIRGLDLARGVDSGRTLGSAQSHQYASHTHTFTGTAYAGHTHTGTTSSDSHTHTFSGTTVSAGSHSHTDTYVGGWADGTPTTPVGRTGSTGSAVLTNDAAGAHTHTFSGTTSSDSHTHTFTTATGGAFTPAGTNAASGGTTNGSETRPRNVAMIYLIKY